LFFSKTQIFFANFLFLVCGMLQMVTWLRNKAAAVTRAAREASEKI
jgi:hypothetical protein